MDRKMGDLANKLASLAVKKEKARDYIDSCIEKKMNAVQSLRQRKN